MKTLPLPKKKNRSSIIHALILQGNILRLSGQRFAPKKGKGAKYDRKANKRVEY